MKIIIIIIMIIYKILYGQQNGFQDSLLKIQIERYYIIDNINLI